MVTYSASNVALGHQLLSFVIIVIEMSPLIPVFACKNEAFSGVRQFELLLTPLRGTPVTAL
jgi:hypothetical protein